MLHLRRNIISIIFILSCLVSEGQEASLNPVSIKIFNPFLFNPAITGSKDFSSANTIVSFHDGSSSQIFSGEARLSKKAPAYFLYPSDREFSNIGLGGAFYNDNNGTSSHIGASFSVAYHIPVNKQKLSFLSLGTRVKAIQSIIDYSVSEDSIISPAFKETEFPKMDFGGYFYGPSFYFGLSVANLLGNPAEADSLGVNQIPKSQKSFLLAGYKVLLSKSHNIVLEPSVIISSEDFSFQLKRNDIQAIVRIYLQNFCVGMHFNDSSKNSFFFQYRYPGFYLGAYFGIPKNSVFYLKKPIIEISAGINLSRGKSGVKQPIHW